MIPALLLAASLSAAVERFAVVVGNNAADRPGVAVLKYADDDAVATHRLLIDAGVTSRLLVTLDQDSRQLYRGLSPSGPARLAALRATLAELWPMIARASARGSNTELLFFYSGHGDVDDGEGYVVLEGDRLTRRLLYEEILAASPATANHVIVDACKSYFLAFNKGPGGERERFAIRFAARAAAPLERTGFVLSTSSGRDSHEWERYQAGVFSHQVRSALRGAADADADGVITYAEVGAFLANANQAIANARYRPDFLVQPPGAGPEDLTRALLRWPGSAAALRLDRPDTGHVYVESPLGERLADAHPAPHSAIELHLPGDRPLFVRRADDDREWLLEGAGSASLSSLLPGPVRVARKGAQHIAFESLFAVPFDAQSVRAWSAVHKRSFELVTATPAPGEGAVLRWTGATLGVVGAAALGGAGWFGLQSRAAVRDLEQAPPGTSQLDAIAMHERAQSSADRAQLLLAVGGTALLSAVGMWVWHQLQSDDDGYRLELSSPETPAEVSSTDTPPER